jgi:DNA-binding NarL/FixJ family response regulator
MADYAATEMDDLARAAPNVLLCGAGIARPSGAFRLEAADGDLHATLERALPDILVLDAALASVELAAALAGPRLAGVPVILLAGDADGDAAGLLLGLNVVAFLPSDTSADALAAALRAVETVGGVADMNAGFDADSRIAALRRDAERVAAALAEMAQERGEQRAAPPPVDGPRIRAHIKARRIRERFFPADLFADPAWDILLDLSAARLEGRRVSVSSLCIAATVPTTTGLRWIKSMIDQKLLLRASDPDDARRAFILMAPATATAMETCLEACLNLPGQ